MGLPPQKNIRLPVKNMGLPLKNMGLPLKNFIASQLGRGGGRLRILYALPHLERSFTLKTIVFHEAVFGSSSNGPPGFLLWGGTLHEDTKNGWVRVGDNQDPAEY